MLKSFTRYRKLLGTSIRFQHQKNELESVVEVNEISRKTSSNYELFDETSIEDAIIRISREKPKSVFEKCEEDLSYIAPYLKPTFNFAAYVNQSETLQELLKLGVNLHKLEKKKGVPDYILGLDFERDIKEHIIFLHNLGLAVEEIGHLLTQNPYIFKESFDDLRTRINYLKYKKFNDEMILRIVGCNPFWLQFSTQKIDARLGFFQKHFALNGNEVRAVTVKKPRLITYNMHHVKVNSFVVKEEMGFNTQEEKAILLEQPGIFMKRQENLLKTFEYLHKTMEIPLEDIVKCPQILTCREHRLKERYLFLRKLNRLQFDPKIPNYISVLAMVSGTDSDFATEVAKSSVHAYNEFLKSL